MKRGGGLTRSPYDADREAALQIEREKRRAGTDNDGQKTKKESRPTPKELKVARDSTSSPPAKKSKSSSSVVESAPSHPSLVASTQVAQSLSRPTDASLPTGKPAPLR